MQEVGAQLREAREARAMSVEDVAQITKIPRGTLEALERGDAALLPPMVFVRGFVRAYAGAVELDPSDLVAQLEAEEAETTSSAASRGRAPGSRGGLGTRDPLTDMVGLDGSPRLGGLRPGAVLLVLVAIGMFLAAWFLAGSRAASQQAAGIDPPEEIQRRVDGVSTYTSSPSPAAPRSGRR